MERLRVVNLLAEEQVASLKHTVHIGMIEALGIMREGKPMVGLGERAADMQPCAWSVDFFYFTTLRATAE